MKNEYTKILIVGPAWVGDMVMAQTLFKLLKQRQPNCVIDVLAPNWSRPLLERMPEIRQTLALPIGHRQLQLSQRYKIAKQLRSHHYDHAIVLPNSFKSALIPLWAKIPKRTGWLGEFRWGLLNDVRYLDKNKWPLMIERFMALTITSLENLPVNLPRPSLSVKQADVDKAMAKYHLEVRNKPILALCPGAEFGPAKRWPAHHFAEIATEKINQGWQVWLFGSSNDQNVAAEIQQSTGSACVDLTGKTTLAEAIDLLSLVQMVVSNDSGLMHIAAALDKPLVVMYGSSSPKFTPPLIDRVKILTLNLACSPCFKRECPLVHMKCLRELLPNQVSFAISELIR